LRLGSAGLEGQVAFSFEDVPPGTYRVEPTAVQTYEWLPRGLRAQPGEVDLVLELDDVAAMRTLRVRASDAEDGREPRGWQARLWLEGGWSFGRAPDAGGAVAFEVPRTRAWILHVTAPGYRARALDSASVRDGDEVRLALERGWGVRLVARAGATSSTPPLEGVRVHVDGVVAGTTGPDGVFEVVRDAAPVRIEAELDGWTPLDHPLEGDDLEHARRDGFVELGFERVD